LPADPGALRIGGNAIWGEYFNGLIDEVRIYNRALSATEILGDMDRGVVADVTTPTITARTPVPGASGINVGSAATVTFSEPMRATTMTAANLTLAEQGGAAVPATVTYDAPTQTATVRPQDALGYGITYRLTVKGSVTDAAGNALGADA